MANLDIQLLTLVQSDNAEEFLNPQLKNKKYSRLQPQHAVIVMEKYALLCPIACFTEQNIDVQSLMLD